MLEMNLQVFAETPGYINQVFVLAGTTPMSNSTGAKIMGIDKSTLKNLADIMEITAFGDTYKKRMSGLLDTNIAIEGNVYVGDTTGQNVFVPGASIMLGIYPQGTAVAGTQVPCIVESAEIDAEVSKQQAIKLTVQCNGAPVALPTRP